MPKLNNLVGKRFGRLLVISHSGKVGKHHMWQCRCDCGNETKVYSCNAVSGKVMSCGCLHRETAAATLRTHGGSKLPLYAIWNSMKQRCVNTRVRNYHIYGGRGIRVCDDWSTFDAFRDWAISNGYAADLSIDRIDVNGNYEPGNCRWATETEQQRNRTNNRAVIRSDGTRFGSIAEAAEKSRCHHNGIANVCSGRAKLSGGYGWQYENRAA